MFANIAPLVASAAFALLAPGTAWSADGQPASPSAPVSPQPAVASPVAPTLGAATSEAAAGASLGAKDSATAAVAPTAAPASLDNRIQELKGDVIRLNRDLLVLEEELLFPANTQVALFVSMDVGKLFDLDSVQIKLDDKVVTNYLYTPLEVQALHRGGVQRAYLGNLKAGSHEIVAFFTGKGPHDRDYKRGTTVKFDKGTDPKYIELRIKDSTGKLQPEFEVKVWQ
ncbi:MAG TPA: AraC family transcriptional regulator [Burkholderiaceae bacterium]|nr:AraC family transcriptional regulator [Burkholderiaceae bacterium]